MKETKNKKQKEEKETEYLGFKEDEYLKKLHSEKKKILLSMNTDFTYTGFIIGVSKNSFLFKDKFNQEMMFWIKDIKRLLVINSEGKR